MTARAKWQPPGVWVHELTDVPGALAHRVEALLADAPVPAAGGNTRHRYRVERQVGTLCDLHRRRQAVERARAAQRIVDDGLVRASDERHRELANLTRGMRGLLELQIGYAVLHEDLGECDPADVALAAGVPCTRVDELVEEERARAAGYGS
jgi:hypothetical protein